MDWPARSPDLNPIEHIWDIMSRPIHPPTPRCTTDCPGVGGCFSPGIISMCKRQGCLHFQHLSTLMHFPWWGLTALVTHQQNGRDEAEDRLCKDRQLCVAIVTVTEAWLDNNIPDAAVELTGRSLLRADRTAASEKHRGGANVKSALEELYCTA
ncbi:hypothetical protein L3Q82_006432 [Scortum barcoo]|uniref:Uncharacterized protein n=1 Tax=Scortum barcoo TaxID=214431 RepID=A0ACB8X0M2_9TELE|nr:hypothetical protein L3Q82_006432 [Scortum barcoo]